MSLRIKFLGLLVVIPSICLVFFLYFAVNIFVTDKTSYLFESQFQLLNSASLYLSKNDSFTALDSDDEVYKKKIENLFKQEGFESLFVLNEKGYLVYSQDPKNNNKSLKDILGSGIYEKLISFKVTEGSFEAKDQLGEIRLISFLKLSTLNGERIFLLHTLKSGAIRASLLFLLKSLSVFTALIALSALISIIFSNKLTLGIRNLSRAMREFGEGKFDSVIPKFTDDEVGQMSKQFNVMRAQISHLLVEKENKVKIETEMKLAGDLQKKFFPKSQFATEGVELEGYFEPANDAGGDWWFYFHKDDKFIFLIGDVTGHGLNSAMITGVSRSALSLIEDNFISPSESLRLMNRAIYESSNGQLNMTCFLGCLDLKTGIVVYSNASHEAPFVLPPINKSLKLKDIENLAESTGPRLGEKKYALYPEHSFQLEANSIIFLYSDGLTELRNSKDEMLGERKLISGLGADHKADVKIGTVIQKIKSLVVMHRESRDLKDDLSYMALKWRGL